MTEVQPKPNFLWFLTSPLFITFATLAIWLPHVRENAGFLFSDSGHIVNSIRRGYTFDLHGYLPFITAHRPVGRDAVTLLLRLFGENYNFIGTAQLVVHVLSAICVFLVIQKFTPSKIAATAGALFFSLHPGSYWSIYWTGAIFDLLAVFFALLSLLCFLYSRSSSSRAGILLLIAQLFFFDLAVKSKESSIVVIVPMLFIFAADHLKRNYTKGIKWTEALKRTFRSVLKREWYWLLALVVLATLLATFITSDFRPEIENRPADIPYTRDASFNTIFKSFGFYLAFTAYSPENQAPMSAVAAALLIAAIGISVLYRRDFLIALGLIWWGSFLLFLSMLVNMYFSPNYPYASLVGAGMMIAGVLRSCPRKLEVLLASLLILIFLYKGWAWNTVDSIPGWYRAVNAEGVKMRKSLRKSVRSPQSGAHFVLVVPRYSLLDQGDIFVQALYKDLSLSSKTFPDRDAAEEYIRQNPALLPQSTIRLEWADDHFKKFENREN